VVVYICLLVRLEYDLQSCNYRPPLAVRCNILEVIVITITCLLTMYAIETIDTVYRIVHYCVTSKNNVDRSC
jgi:hypothetical protein